MIVEEMRDERLNMKGNQRFSIRHWWTQFLEKQQAVVEFELADVTCPFRAEHSCSTQKRDR